MTGLPTLFVTLFLAAGQPTVWTGVYTAAQADRGEAAYHQSCSGCHQANLSGYGRLLVGEKFMDHWREDSLDSFYQLMKMSMPRGAPASLGDEQYLEILAYILQANEFPAGRADLNLAALKSIRVEGKDGPQPVPDFALVRTVGCLKQIGGGEWVVEHASAAKRTRNPKESAPEEGKSESALSGSEVFHFLHLMPYDVSNYRMEEQKGHKVEAKGFLIRKGPDQVLNLTAVATVASACIP